MQSSRVSNDSNSISNKLSALLDKHQNIDPDFAAQIFSIIDPGADERQPARQ